MNWLTNLFKPSDKNKKRGYEGGARGKRLSRWHTTSRDANAELSGDLPTMRNRSRDLRRNNPYAARAIMAIANNVIGKGIKTQIRGSNQNLEQTWKDWTASKNFHYEKRMNMMEMQHLVVQSVVESGEVLIRRRIDSSRDFPTCYQILEGDFIDTTRSDVRLPNGNFILQGIEFNQSGQREAYYLYERHPGSVVADPKSSFSSSRVPASEIHHVFRQDRPGQVRGVPWLAPVILRLKDLDDYEDAQLLRQKIAACFTVFVKDINGDVECDDESADLGSRIEPGAVEFLPPGKDIEFATPPTVENFGEFNRVTLRGIAVGIGVTYEVLSSDLSEVNFSSGRMGHLEFQRNIDTWRSNLVISQVIDPIIDEFKSMLTILGESTSDAKFIHVPPRREMIDPTREIPAIKDAIRIGISTLSEEIMAQGRDPEEHFAQYKKDNEMLDKLEITLDSDARKVSQDGGIQKGDVVNEEV